MYAVIFKAKVKVLDAQYADAAKRMRDLAMAEYNCQEFVSSTEGNTEIAISYWQCEEDILAWRNNAEHLATQKLEQEKWYESYTVEVVKVLRSYGSPSQ
jgi:heme-degrading monooxygenase HmoA